MTSVLSKTRDVSRLSFPMKIGASILLLVIVLVISNIGGITPSSELLLLASNDSNADTSSTYEQSETALKVSTVDTPNFLELGKKFGTDKVKGTLTLPDCQRDSAKCSRPDATNEQCKIIGHYYDSTYQKWLGPLANQRFQFLEIGFYHGDGFDAFSAMMPLAEKHSMEISCIEPGPREEGKWPWGNFAAKSKNYKSLREANRLHCGDANDFQFLTRTWKTHMKRPDAPPLKVVVEDASHLSQHMATSVFFWLPRIAPGGILVIEDIESNTSANKFRTDLLPQLMKDLNYCGLPEEAEKGVEYDEGQSMPPPNALDLMQCRNT